MKLKAKTRTRNGQGTFQPGETFEIDDKAGEAMLKQGIAYPEDYKMPAEKDAKATAKAKK